MPFLRQSTAQMILFGPCLDATNGVTEEIALTLAQADMRLSKDGAAFAQKSAAGNATHDSDGWYSTTLSTTDTNTIGELRLNVHQPANMLPVWDRWWVIEEGIYDALFGASAVGFDSNQRVDVGLWLGSVVTSGTGGPDVNINAISDDVTAATNAEAFFDGTGYAGINNVIPTVTTLTGHTAQTGDSFARLGAPAGAGVSTDIAAIKAETALIVTDTNELQTDWVDAGRLDTILDARASQTTVDAIETDTQDIQTRLPAALVSGRMSSDVIAISSDTTAADNLELQYDTNGLTGDTFPATQSQLSQVANISGVVKRAASSYVLTTGTQSANTVSSVEELDGTRHEHTDDAGAMDLYYQFSVGSGLATAISMTGYLQGANDDLEVYGYDWVSVGWKQIGTLAGQATANNVVNAYDLLVDMVGSGANAGLVRVRFTDGAFTLTTATLAVDQILVEFAQGVEGYENGAVWLDTNASNTNVVRGVDGTATNPVSTIAAVNTLLSSTNLSRIQVSPQSSFTLAATQANQQFIGKNWTLALGGQSISGSYFEGASVTGIGTGASEVRFQHCHLGAVTLPPCDCEDSILEGTFTMGTAGDFFFENCKSGVAGTGTPVLDFGGALNSSNANFRAYSGGIEIQNMGTGTGSYNMSLEGNGQLFINANCSATSTVAIRGHFTITDNAGGAVTLSDDARITRSELVDDMADEPLTGATHNVSNSWGRRIRELDDQLGYEGGSIWLDTANGAAGAVVGENGTVNNPVDNITDALTLAVVIGLVRIRVASGSTVTLLAALDGYEIFNSNWTLVLNGQSISNSCIIGASVSGLCTGASPPDFIDCHFDNATLPPCHAIRCGFGGTITAGSVGEFFFDTCHSSVAGTSAPVFDFGAALNASNLNYRSYSGGVEIQNMGTGTGSYNMSLEGNGQLIINANCSATSTVVIRGHFTVTDNAGGAVTLSDEARFDVAQVTGGAYALDTDANGRVRIVDGTSAGELDTDSGTVALRAATQISIDAIEADTNELQSDDVPGLIAALNDLSVADILTTQMTQSYAADGVAPTLAQALFLIQQSIGDFAISGTTLTVRQLDGSTTAATYTLDDASDPTSRTRAT